ncbi:hypothetical protein DFP93_102449 [Aneurinibacillus soli]|uniref:Putative permease n=1 Tax=Aneurinibacillus soli TaxID=1500254 RepID=A0A0U5B8Q7_9BACL|nr:permease [Aneurinibacillus soli]PYE63759.1 hypothetical protein DFP93_102449 [Aneurinibacillus soli]BAU27308.1 putative permease [Aneurinibacillus soli]
MWQHAETIFLSIVLESLPFIVIGALLSSFIQHLVPRRLLFRLLPKSRPLAVVYAAFLGFVFPVCDCGTVPVARSLIHKGMPVSAAITFVLAAPVTNPLTLAATYAAFGGRLNMLLIRLGAALLISILIGWGLLFFRMEQSKRVESVGKMDEPTLSRHTTGKILSHALGEIFEVGVFVVVSAAVAAGIQTWLPTSAWESVGRHPILSVIALMSLSVVLSLCAQADAFVARSLQGVTTGGAVVSFLLIGQMIDIRNLLLLPRAFDHRVVVFVFTLAFALVLLLGIGLNYAGFRL